MALIYTHFILKKIAERMEIELETNMSQGETSSSNSSNDIFDFSACY